MMDLDPRRLRMLRELREHGTLARVASALDYSPSTISQQLAALEKEVGVRLLEKAGRGVNLTAAGHLLVEHAGVILAAVEAARLDLSELSGQVRGRVHAVGVQSALRRLLIPALAVTSGRFEQVRVELSELELEAALPELRLGRVDLVVVDEYHGQPRPRPAGLDFEPLLDEPMRLVLPAGHPLARSHGSVPLNELAGQVWAASARNTGHHEMVVAVCREHGGFDPDLRHLSSDAEAQLEVVRRAGAVALLSELSLPVDDPGLVTRPVAGADLGRRLFMVTRQGPRAPALREFVRALREQVGERLPRT